MVRAVDAPRVNLLLAVVAARYRDRQPNRFPVAVVFIVPKRVATR